MEKWYSDELKSKIFGVYEEILLKSMYNRGCSNPRSINSADIDVLCEALKALIKMREEYKTDYVSRIVLGKEISSLAQDLLILSGTINDEVNYSRTHFKSEQKLFVDMEKFISLVYTAQSSPEFALRTIHVHGLASMEEKHGTRETKIIKGVVYLIGDAEILAELPEEEAIEEGKIRKLTTRLAESGKSLIIATNYYFSPNLLPVTKTTELEVKTHGVGAIRCYLQEDVLKETVNRLLGYALEKGNHIDDIPDDEILKNIVPNAGKNIKLQPLDETKHGE